MGYKYQRDAEKLGAMGRNGDSMIMHVNPLEVEALNSIYPGSITINPDTGQPEAFFWLIPAIVQAAVGGIGSAAGALGGALGGAFGTSALGSAVGSTLAAPLTTAASALGGVGGVGAAGGATGGIAGSMGGLSAALGAPAGVTSALSGVVPGAVGGAGGAGAGAGVGAGAGAGSGAGAGAGAAGAKTGIAGAIETGASKLGSMAAGQVTGPTDLLTTGINKGVGAIKSLGAKIAPKATADVGSKAITQGGVPGGGAQPGVPGGGISTPPPVNPVAAPQSAIKTALEPVKQGLGAKPAAAIKASTEPIKQGLAAVKGNIPKTADLSNMIASQGNPGIEAQALGSSPVTQGPAYTPQPIGGPNVGSLPTNPVPDVTSGMSNATRAQLGVPEITPTRLLQDPLGQAARTQNPLGPGLDAGSSAMKGFRPLGEQIQTISNKAEAAKNFMKYPKRMPYGSQNPGIAPTNALGNAQDLFTGSSGRTLAQRSAAVGKDAFGGLKTGLGEAAKFSSENPMLVLGGGYMANQALQDEQEMPGWAKKMQSDGMGPGEIWSDDYAMQVLPNFQGMESPQDWEDQWYVSQFNPFANPSYTRMAGGGYVNPPRYAGGGIVNAPRYAGGGYINPRLRRP